MKNEVYLKKDLVTEDRLSPEGVLAYVSLRRIMDSEFDLYNKDNPVSCVSINRMAFVSMGSVDKQYLNSLKVNAS